MISTGINHSIYRFSTLLTKARTGPYQGRHVDRVPQLSARSERSAPPNPITENNFLTRLEPHLPHAGESCSDSSARRKKASKRLPHSSHLNSKIGISSTPLVASSFELLLPVPTH